MTHQLMLSAKKKWRKLDSQNRLPRDHPRVEFRDGIKHETKPPDTPSPTFGHSSHPESAPDAQNRLTGTSPLSKSLTLIWRTGVALSV